MAKHTSKEAYYERLKNLAEVSKPSIKESKTRNLGSLIDYKRATDGVVYGIVKENHNYYIKKAGTKKDPNVSDFAYIGGMQNITGYQFKSLAEADKQRNMMFHTISEANTLKPNKSGSKMVLTEDIAEKEIEMATDKLGDLDVATQAEKEVPAEMPGLEGGDEMEAGLEAEPAVDGVDAGLEGEPAVDGAVDAVDAETDAVDAVDGDAEADGEPALDGEEDESGDSILSQIKELGKKLMEKDFTDKEVVKYVDKFLGYFHNDFEKMEVDMLEALANKILEVNKEKNIEDLESTMPEEEPVDVNAEVAEGQCAECGSFAQYAESRGYDSAESLMECGEEEVGNLVSGYANAHNDGMNDGDMDNVALVIKVVNPEILNQLKNDYGHEEYADQISPIVTGMNESSDEENMAKLNELFGNLGRMVGGAAKKVGGDIKQGAQNVGTAIGNKAQDLYNKGTEKVTQATDAVKQYGKDVKQAAHGAVVPVEVKKLEKEAGKLGQQIAALNSRLVKAGQAEVDLKRIMQAVSQQVGATKGAGVAGLGLAEDIDPANVEVQPSLEEDVTITVSEKAGKKLSASGAPVKEMKEGVEPEEDEIEKDDIDVEVGDDDVENGEVDVEMGDEIEKDEPTFAPGFQSMGGGVVKPEGAEVTTVEVTKDSVKVEMNESEKKLRKYIRERLEVKAGLKKATLNENKKSETLKKLDTIIDSQFKLYEGVVSKKKVESVNEVLGLDKLGINITKPEQVAAAYSKVDPNNKMEVKKLFYKAFRDILNNPKMGAILNSAKSTPIPALYKILGQYVQNGGGTLRVGGEGIEYAPIAVKNAATKSAFSSGGTQGKTQLGGV